MPTDTAIVPPDRDAMIWSAPPPHDSRPPLLVMLHGHGGNEQDMADCFSSLPAGLLAVSLRAPVALGDRWTWYDFRRQERAAFHAAARGVLAWVDSLPSDHPIGLFGFSQGGALAIQLMRLAPRRFRYAVHLSAFVMPGRVAGDSELAAARPPVFCAHGAQDDVITVDDPLRRLPWLRSHTALTERTYPELGHVMTTAVLEDANQFIRRQLRSEADRLVEFHR